MRILQLISDWKWTGPAETVLNLAVQLKREGNEVFFGCSEALHHCDPTGLLRERAVKAGIEPIPGLHLKKNKDAFRNLHLSSMVRDANFLRRFIHKERIELVHANLTHDHLLARIAVRDMRLRPAVVRTNHSATPLPFNLGNFILMKYFTDGYLTLSEKAFDRDRRHFAGCGVKIGKIAPAVDIGRFNPERNYRDIRRELKIGPDDIVVGVVARVQRHRKFETFLKAACLASQKFPSLKFLVVGRGTHMDEIARRPAQEMGISDRMIFAGYRTDDYLSVIQCFDMKIFLVPGSDGSCRAVRELMAMGKPIIAMKIGILPELVEHEKTGLLIAESAEELAQAILRLACDRELRMRMGKAGRQKAENDFHPARQMEQIIAFYRLMANRKGNL